MIGCSRRRRRRPDGRRRLHHDGQLRRVARSLRSVRTTAGAGLVGRLPRRRGVPALRQDGTGRFDYRLRLAEVSSREEGLGAVPSRRVLSVTVVRVGQREVGESLRQILVRPPRVIVAASAAHPPHAAPVHALPRRRFGGEALEVRQSVPAAARAAGGGGRRIRLAADAAGEVGRLGPSGAGWPRLRWRGGRRRCGGGATGSGRGGVESALLGRRSLRFGGGRLRRGRVEFPLGGLVGRYHHTPGQQELPVPLTVLLSHEVDSARHAAIAAVITGRRAGDARRQRAVKLVASTGSRRRVAIVDSCDVGTAQQPVSREPDEHGSVRITRRVHARPTDSGTRRKDPRPGPSRPKRAPEWAERTSPSNATGAERRPEAQGAQAPP